MKNETLIANNDNLLHFSFNNIPVRGRIIRLQQTSKDALMHNIYNENLSNHLIQGLVVNALIRSLFKSSGTLKMQISDTENFSLLATDIDENNNIRGYIRNKKEKISPKILITLDQGEDTEVYQSISEFHGNVFAKSIDSFFKESEQISTLTVLFSDGKDTKTAFGIFLQRLSSYNLSAYDKDMVDDSWKRMEFLLQTITKKEALDINLPYSELLFRLFHEDDVALHNQYKISYQCRCSEEKAKNAFSLLTPQDKLDIIAEGKKIEITCDFCGKVYSYLD